MELLAREQMGLKADVQDDDTTYEVVALLKRKKITVDRASRILMDAQTLIEKTTQLD